jgi:cob(I)alamin adenosyltransferase
MVRVHLYTGKGEGKTLTALGLAMRSIGHNRKVIMVQFMKGREDVGEFKVQKKLRLLEIHQFGRKGFVDLENPSKLDKKKAKKGIKFANEVLKKKIDVLILDEVNLAARIGLISEDDVLDLIKKADKKTLIILTGRDAPKSFHKIADLITDMREIKHPYYKGEKAKKGIEN